VHHNFPITRNDQNTDQQKWSEKTIDDRRPRQSFDGVNMREIQRDSDNR
jgi:hypothetical protein